MERQEYKTDYFYFAVRPDKRDGKDVLIYCSGINVTRFMPMLQGRLGLGSNPVISGLQLVKYDLCTLAHSKGSTPREHCCNIGSAGNHPTKDYWYTEPLLIENPSGLTPAEILDFVVKGIIKKINAASLSEQKLPDNLPPSELQKYLDIVAKPS